jgi:adenylate cyclase
MPFMEKAIEHSLIGGPPKRMLGMLYAQVDRVQEAQTIFAEGLKGFPASLANVRWFMSNWSIEDSQLMERFAEGYIKAGLPGESGGFYKISKENRLSSEEIKKLFFGRKVSGFTLTSGKKWQVERSKDGKAKILSGDDSDSGKSWIEEDMLCNQWDNLYEGLKDCWVIYRNPGGTPENNDEYIGAPGYGLYLFSLVE